MRFDEMTNAGQFTSTREAYRELEDNGGAAFEWAKNNASLFTIPDGTEGAFVAKIYSINHFQSNIERQKILNGGRNADPFLIARAASIHGTVVTMEALKPNAAKIPNICLHFGIVCFSLEMFMDEEGWTF